MEKIEKIDEIYIENQDNIIMDYDLLKELLDSNIKDCVFKMKFKIEKEGRSGLKTGTGFICNISNIKFFITNNHVLDQEFLNSEKKLIIYNYKNEKKEINLGLNRYKYTDEELDFTIIEIINEDNIINYLEIDEFIDSTDYKNEKICAFQYPGGNNLKYSEGNINSLKDNYFLYSVGTLSGSSGAPLILINNKKVIGLHKAGYNQIKENKINIGIPMNLIINKINFIKCIYNIKKEDIGKEIQIINNKYYDMGEEMNNDEIEKKIKIMINGEEIKSLKYKFNKEGKYSVYLFQKESIFDMSGMFLWCEFLEEINLSLFKIDKVTNMSNMLNGCASLKEINLSSSFKTDDVTDMSKMFYGCSLLKEINLSSFKTDKVIDMSYMFGKCSELIEVDLSSFNTDNVTKMANMFDGCSSLKEINLSSVTNDKVTDMSSMFSGCSKLEEINISTFKNENVKDMSRMFYNCTLLKKIYLSGYLKNDNLTNISYMFYKCSSLKEIDLSSFKTDKVTDMSRMFFECTALISINLSSFKVDNVTDMSWMFYNCSSLKEIKLLSFKNDMKIKKEEMFLNVPDSCNIICDDEASLIELNKLKKNTNCLII